MKNKIAILILTYNEESNIKDCIETANFADEIIVIDSGSSDNTKAIAESMGAKFIYNEMTGFAKQRNFALLQTKCEWVLNLPTRCKIIDQYGKSCGRLQNHRRQQKRQQKP